MFIEKRIQDEIQQFFLYKGEESMLLYEIVEKENFFLDKQIVVPEKALKTSDERVGVDVRFIIYCIDNLAKINKGMAIIHNHFNNLVFSEQDLITIKKILAVAAERNLSGISFLIFESSSSKMALKHFRLNSETNTYAETGERIDFE